MSNNGIITIGRQFGSGGREIGARLAKSLNLPLYDKNLVELAAEKLDISEDRAESIDETALSGFLSAYGYPPGAIMPYVGNVEYLEHINDRMFLAQVGIIRELAKKGPAIFIGRCADYVLRDTASCLSVFICADKEDRIKRTMEIFNLSERKAAEKIKKLDRERRYYYEVYTGKEWGTPATHDMILNVSRLGMERTVKCLEWIYKGMTLEEPELE